MCKRWRSLIVLMQAMGSQEKLFEQGKSTLNSQVLQRYPWL